MKKENHFHRVRDGLTINLAEVAFVEDRTAHYASEPENRYCRAFLDAGTMWRAELRGRNAMDGVSFGQAFALTPEEGRLLQDALDWYNRQNLTD